MELTCVDYPGDLVTADWRAVDWVAAKLGLQTWCLQLFFKGLTKTLNDPMTKDFISKETK